jgi:phosphate transport system substrate-binding protein
MQSLRGKIANLFRNRQLFWIIFILAGFIFSVVSCKNDRGTIKETPTSGKIKVSVDESYQLIMEAEINTFTQIYKYAEITAEYKPEYDVISDFMNDSVKVIVTSHEPTEDQIEYLNTQQINVRTNIFAYDALALIMNKENPDSLLKFNTIQEIFQGKLTSWKEINPASNLDKISVIFDNKKSGNIRYFKEKFEITENLPDHFYAVNNNEEVIDYISRNKNGLGIISVNWISDTDDSLSTSFINKIKVVAVSHPHLDPGTYYRPYQGSIYDETYPFRREVYLVSRETFAGLGSGFIAWLVGEKGQRIVLKSGLVPATMPIRLIQVKKQ